PYDKNLTLSKEDLAALFTRIKEADFFKIKEKFKGSATDQNTLFLDITVGGQSHQVQVYGYRFIRDKADQDEVDRFLKVWVEVLKKVPSPNPDNLDLFKAGAAVEKAKAPPPADRRLRLTIPIQNSLPFSVAFSPDGKRLAASGQSGAVQLWDVANGENVATFAGPKRLIYSLAFSPDGKTVAAGRSDGTIVLYDVA